MMVLASSDMHVPTFSTDFLASFSTTVKENQPAILLLAGDIVNKGDPSSLGSFLDELKKMYTGRVIACQGNEEYEEKFDDIRAASRNMIEWLVNEIGVYDVLGSRLVVLGTKGALERPTYWQRTHVNDMWKIRSTQIQTIKSKLNELRSVQAEYKIVLSHYSPTRATMLGEREKMWPEMGYPDFEDEIRTGGFNIWVHGHIHRGAIEFVTIGDVKVYNVAFPARKKPIWVLRLSLLDCGVEQG